MNKSMLMGMVAGIGVATAGGVLGYQFLGSKARVVVGRRPAVAAPAATAPRAPAARARGHADRAAAAPAEECWDEEVTVTADPKDQHAIAGTAVGAVVGGAIGKDVGDRDITTAAGAAAGAFIGRKIQERSPGKPCRQRTTTTRRAPLRPARQRSALTLTYLFGSTPGPDSRRRCRPFFFAGGHRRASGNANHLQQQRAFGRLTAPRSNGCVQTMVRSTIFWIHLVCGVVDGPRRADDVRDRRAPDVRAADASLGPTDDLPAPRPRRATPDRSRSSWRPPSCIDRNSRRRRSCVRNEPDARRRVRAPAATARCSSTRIRAPCAEPGARGHARFFSAVTGWHRWFNATGENRATARAITGASNLAFLFLVLSGIYLWLPRMWKWAAFKTRLLFNAKATTAKARDFNWHHVFGIWSAIPLAVVVATATVFSYPWANDLVYRAVGEQPPVRGGGGGGGRPAGRGPATGAKRPSIAPERHGASTALVLRRVARARGAEHGEWRTLTLNIPDRIERADGAHRHRSRQRRPAAPAPHSHARRRDGRRRDLGAVLESDDGTEGALVDPLPAHGRSAGPRRPNDRRARVAHERVDGVDGARARVAAADCSRCSRRKSATREP